LRPPKKSRREEDMPRKSDERSAKDIYRDVKDNLEVLGRVMNLIELGERDLSNWQLVINCSREIKSDIQKLQKLATEELETQIMKEA